jgi:hypothetical protein
MSEGTSAAFPEDTSIRGKEPSEGATLGSSPIVCNIEGRGRGIFEVLLQCGGIPKRHIMLNQRGLLPWRQVVQVCPKGGLSRVGLIRVLVAPETNRCDDFDYIELDAIALVGNVVALKRRDGWQPPGMAA